MGWYLDNLELDTAGSEIPEKVTGLKAVVDQKGLCISFVKVEEPDVENYRIERRSADSEFEEVAMLDKDAKEEFINNGVKLTTGSSGMMIPQRQEKHTGIVSGLSTLVGRKGHGQMR